MLSSSVPPPPNCVLHELVNSAALDSRPTQTVPTFRERDRLQADYLPAIELLAFNLPCMWGSFDHFVISAIPVISDN